MVLLLCGGTKNQPLGKLVVDRPEDSPQKEPQRDGRADPFAWCCQWEFWRVGTSGGRWKLTVLWWAGPQTTADGGGGRATGTASGGGLRAGRPQRGGRAREMGTSEKVDFNLSTETKSVLSPIWRIYLGAPWPVKGHGKKEPEEELKHLLSQKQTEQLTELVEEVLVEKVQHDEVEERQIRRLHV